MAGKVVEGSDGGEVDVGVVELTGSLVTRHVKHVVTTAWVVGTFVFTYFNEEFIVMVNVSMTLDIDCRYIIANHILANDGY